MDSSRSEVARHGYSECYLFGERVDIPTPIVQELTRLRALEHQFQDEERERLLAEWEAKHGPLPPPPAGRVLVEVDRWGRPVDGDDDAAVGPGPMGY